MLIMRGVRDPPFREAQCHTRVPLKINKKGIASGADLIRIISTSGSDRGQRDASRPVSRVLYGRGRPRRDGHSSGTPVAGRLEQPTRARRPTDEAPLDARGRQAHRSYSVLLPAGLAVPPTLPPARCALAAPFHPYRCAGPCGPRPAVCLLWRFPWGRPRRTLSGAVSVWSPDFPPLLNGGRPADWRNRHMGARRRRSRRKGLPRPRPASPARSGRPRRRRSFIAPTARPCTRPAEIRPCRR